MNEAHLDTVELRELRRVRQVASVASRADRTAAEALLFLLELAKTTGEPAFLEVASMGAEDLAKDWSDSEAGASANATGNDSATNDCLSRTAFSLAEAWTTTRNVVYRDACLDILWYLAGARLAARSEAEPHRGAH